MAEYPEKMPWKIDTVALVSAIGTSLQRAPQLLSRILEGLEDIEILGIALGASNCSVRVAMAEKDTGEAVERIHDLIVRSGSDNA
jgi:aspartokinase